MRLLPILSSLVACAPDPISDAQLSPPGACAVAADHVLTPRIFGGGGGIGQAGGRVSYSTDFQLIDRFRAVAPGDTIGVEIDVDPDAYVTRGDVLDGSVFIRGDLPFGAAGIPMTVLDVVTAGQLGIRLGAAELFLSGPQEAVFRWSAEMGPFVYGDDLPCFGVVLQVPTAAALPPSFEVPLTWAGWGTSVAVPDHGGNPLRQGPLPPPSPRAQILGSCNQMPVTIEIEGATPLGQVALVSGQYGGTTRIPSGACAGTQIPLTQVQLRQVLQVDAAGHHSLRVNLPRQVCQNVVLAAVDLTACVAGSP